MKTEIITGEKIYMSQYTYILCIAHDGDWYDMYMMHDKYPAVLKLFGAVSCKCPDRDTLLYVAQQGFEDSKQQYLELLDFLDGGTRHE